MTYTTKFHAQIVSTVTNLCESNSFQLLTVAEHAHRTKHQVSMGAAISLMQSLSDSAITIRITVRRVLQPSHTYLRWFFSGRGERGNGEGRT